MAKRLNELTKGDKVAYASRWYSISFGSFHRIWEEATVEKDTDTQITVNSQRFLRRNGYKVGDSSRRPTRIVPWSEEVEKEIEEINAAIAEHEERQKLLAVINSITIKNLPLEQLRAIVEVLRPEGDAE